MGIIEIVVIRFSMLPSEGHYGISSSAKSRMSSPPFSVERLRWLGLQCLGVILVCAPHRNKSPVVTLFLYFADASKVLTNFLRLLYHLHVVHSCYRGHCLYISPHVLTDVLRNRSHKTGKNNYTHTRTTVSNKHALSMVFYLVSIHNLHQLVSANYLIKN